MTTSASRKDRVRAHRRRINTWSIGWAAAFMADGLMRLLGAPPGPAAVAGLALVTAGMATGTVLAYRRFLLEADEFERKVELDALAIALGAGLVAATAVHILAQGGVVREPALTTVLMAMFVAYIAGVVIGRHRYR